MKARAGEPLSGRSRFCSLDSSRARTERIASVKGQLNNRADVFVLDEHLELLLKLLKHLGDGGEVESDVVLQHEQLKMEGDQRALARGAQVWLGDSRPDLLAVLMKRVKDDDTLLDALHVEVVHSLYVRVKQSRERLGDLLRTRTCGMRGQDAHKEAAICGIHQSRRQDMGDAAGSARRRRCSQLGQVEIMEFTDARAAHLSCLPSSAS